MPIGVGMNLAPAAGGGDGHKGAVQEKEIVREAACNYHLDDPELTSAEVASMLIADRLMSPPKSQTVEVALESAARKVRRWWAEMEAAPSKSKLGKRQRKVLKQLWIRSEVSRFQKV